MPISIHDDAAAEMQRHFDWYQLRNPQVANRLADLFESTIVQIAANPGQFPLMEMHRNPGNIRRARLKGFPLVVLYRVTDADVHVIAVSHTSQQPGYWKSRLKE
jgi:plasmid stabilization system protein ParE